MNTLLEISEKIGTNYSYLKNLITHSDKFYYSYYIRKISGKKRLIDAPNYEIKAIQSWILRNILEKIPISDRANGFVKGRSIKTNARFHVGKKFIMCLDVQDFFPSIKFSDVFNIFQRLFNDEISKQLSKICTFQGYLPQGGVTSPALSNIVFKSIDEEITKLCNNKNINYSRYADDFTFSSNNLDWLNELFPLIKDMLNMAGYKLAKKKTRFYRGNRRMVVTGLILNSGKITTGRERKRTIRAMVFNHLVKKDNTINLNKLLGNIAFVRGIEPAYFKKLIEYKKRLVEKFK